MKKSWNMGATKAALKFAVLAGAGLGLSGCYTDFGLGYASDGYYASGYDCDPYGQFDRYYDCDYGNGFSNIGYGGGWYDNYYYPGYGLFLFDTYGRRYQMHDDYRRYWGQRRHDWNRGHNQGQGHNGGDRDGHHGYGSNGHGNGGHNGNYGGSGGGRNGGHGQGQGQSQSGSPDAGYQHPGNRPDYGRGRDRYEGAPRDNSGRVIHPRNGNVGQEQIGQEMGRRNRPNGYKAPPVNPQAQAPVRAQPAPRMARPTPQPVVQQVEPSQQREDTSARDEFRGRTQGRRRPE